MITTLKNAQEEKIAMTPYTLGQSEAPQTGLKRMLVTSLLAMGLILPVTEASAATLSRSSAFEYDPVNGLLIKEIIEPGNSQLCLVTQYQYDNFGNKTSITTRNCNGSAGETPAPAAGTDGVITPRTTSITYIDATDNTGRFPLTTQNALLHKETRTYDPKFGNVLSLIGPNLLPTSWQYDSFGRKTREDRADGTWTTWRYALNCGRGNGALSNVSYCIESQSIGDTYSSYVYYDTLNRQLGSSRIAFDQTKWIDEGRVEYDARGRVSKSYLPYEQGSIAKFSTFSYDDLNRVETETAPDGSVTRKTYLGLTGKVTNALGQISTTVRNTQGQTVSVIDAQGNGINYGYDAFGNLVKTIDALGNTTILTYDKRGRKTVMVDPDMGTWIYAYNALGELVRQEDAKAQPVTMAYDKLGRMTQRSENDLISNWYYDTNKAGVACGLSKGKLCQAEAGNTYGYNRSHTYDAKGRLSSITTTAGSDGTYTTSTTYDILGRPDMQTYPVSPTYPSGFAVKNVYKGNYLERVVNGVTVNGVAAGAITYWTANSMDAAGHLTMQTYGNNVSTTQVYDPSTGRLTRQIAGAGNNVQSMDYTYDSLGNLLTRSNLYPSGTGNIALKEGFGYDTLNRVTSANTTGQSTATNGSTTTSFSTPEVFDYNAIGNIVSKTGVGNYTYNPSVTLGGVTRTLPHALGGITGTLNGSINPAFNYDNNGNMLSGAGRTITWTSFNIPKTITSNGKTAEFWYTPEHERIKELQSDGSFVITLSPRYDTGLHFEKRLLATGGVLNGSVEYEHYLYAGGLMFGKYVTINSAAGVLTSSKVEYYHKDHLGSIVAISNEAGAIALDDAGNPKRYAYDVWGKRRNPNGTVNNILNPDMYHGYTGHEMLDDLGLIHMNGRLYDPMTGRFISADFMIPDGGDLQSYNRYSYTRNNPLSYTDPSGQCEIVCWAIIIFGTAEVGYQAGIIDKQTARMIQGIAVSMMLGPQFSGGTQISAGITGNVLGSTLIAGFAGGFVSSDGSFEAGMQGMLSAGLFYGAGSLTEGSPSGGFGKVMAHAVAGCIGASASGGKCRQGALSAGFAEFAGPRVGDWGRYGNVARQAALGGTASVLGGGKFTNGAMTGAYGYLFNDMAHEMSQDGSFRSEGDTAYPQTKEEWSKHNANFAEGAAITIGIALAPEAIFDGVVETAAVRTEARSLAEKLTMDEAKAGAASRGRIMADKINDPRYPSDQFAKMEHMHTTPIGEKIVVHYWQNLVDGMRTGFKFK